MRFTVVGSLNTDLVTSLKSVPRGGETVHADEFETHYGGKGANQAYGLRRLTDPAKSEVALVGCVGNDVFGKDIFQHLSNNKVDVSQLTVLDDARTGVATILVESNGENRIMVYSGANGRVEPPSDYKGSDFVILQNEIPLSTTFEVIRQCREQGITSVLNPSPLPEVPLSEWPKVDILVVNESEASALSGVEVNSRETAENAFPILHNSAGLVIITLGAHGVVWQSADKKDAGFVPAHKASKVVDTTGAGDTFLGAFLSQYEDRTKSTTQRMEFAAKAAALAVTRKGAASSIPALEEVQQSS